MFTGIIVDIGTVADWQPGGADASASVAVDRLALDTVKAGDSIAVNGVCLTVTRAGGGRFEVDISGETLACTALGGLKAGSRVNLETALTPATALGGHLVSGHVDGVGRVLRYTPDGRSTRYEFQTPAALARYIAPKGSIAVDGVSLTVNTVEDNRFSVNIIPHTLEHTVFGQYREGSPVNLEVDIIARYLERLLAARELGARS